MVTTDPHKLFRRSTGKLAATNAFVDASLDAETSSMGSPYLQSGPIQAGEYKIVYGKTIDVRWGYQFSEWTRTEGPHLFLFQINRLGRRSLEGPGQRSEVEVIKVIENPDDVHMNQYVRMLLDLTQPANEVRL